MLKYLSIVGKDGELNNDTMQDVVDYLKELLSSNLLKSLMGLKGHVFWDVVMDVSLPLRNGL
jgi:hypothetical protein